MASPNVSALVAQIQRILPTTGQTAQQYIVVLKTNSVHAAMPTNLIGAVLNASFSSAAQLRHVFSGARPRTPTSGSGSIASGFAGFSALLPPDQLQLLLEHPDVKFIEEDQVISLNNPVRVCALGCVIVCGS